MDGISKLPIMPYDILGWPFKYFFSSNCNNLLFKKSYKYRIHFSISELANDKAVNFVNGFIFLQLSSLDSASKPPSEIVL